MVEFDDHILSSCQPHWRKLAMVVVKAAEKAGLSDDPRGHDTIAARVERLVSAGKLEAQGNLKNWRRSEVRLPNPESRTFTVEIPE